MKNINIKDVNSKITLLTQLHDVMDGINDVSILHQYCKEIFPEYLLNSIFKGDEIIEESIDLDKDSPVTYFNSVIERFSKKYNVGLELIHIRMESDYDSSYVDSHLIIKRPKSLLTIKNIVKQSILQYLPIYRKQLSDYQMQLERKNNPEYAQYLKLKNKFSKLEK